MFVACHPRFEVLAIVVDGVGSDDINSPTQWLSSPSPLLRPLGSRRAQSRAGTASERGCCRSQRSSLPYALRRNAPRRVGSYGSLLATMYQLGFDLQAVPSTF